MTSISYEAKRSELVIKRLETGNVCRVTLVPVGDGRRGVSVLPDEPRLISVFARNPKIKSTAAVWSFGRLFRAAAVGRRSVTSSR